MHGSLGEFNVLPHPTTESVAIERVIKSPKAYNGENGVATFSRLFFSGSFL